MNAARWLGPGCLSLFALGCGGQTRAGVPPPRTLPPPEARVLLTVDSRIVDLVHLGNAVGVLSAVFPKHLADLKECAKPRREPKTWTEIDEIGGDNRRSGQFVPVLEQRISGRFTTLAGTEFLYRIRIDNCQESDFTHEVYAVVGFTDGRLDVRRKWTESSSGETTPTVIGFIQDRADPPAMLVEATDGTLTERVLRKLVDRDETEHAIEDDWDTAASIPRPQDGECRQLVILPSRPATVVAKPVNCR